jgi:hypothetical protein
MTLAMVLISTMKISDPDWNKQKQQYPREVNRIQDIRRTLLMASFTLPFPPSMNTYWRNFRGRTIISKNGREFREAVIQFVIDNNIPKFGDKKLKLTLILRPRDKRKIRASTTVSRRY